MANIVCKAKCMQDLQDNGRSGVEEDQGQQDQQRLHRAGQRAPLHDLLHCIDGWMDGWMDRWMTG